MAEPINTLTSPIAAAALQRAGVAPTRKEPEPQAAPSPISTQPVSPSFRFDPVAGVMITEYYNGSGEVQTQLPSAASVAYMRVGLSPNGMPRESATATETPAVPSAKDVVT